MTTDTPTPPPSDPTPDAPAKTARELEAAAHATLVQAMLPAIANRINILVGTAVETAGHGDVAIWIPLSVLYSGIGNLTFERNGAGEPLRATEVYQNAAKIHLLTAIALERAATQFRAHAAGALALTKDPIALSLAGAEAQRMVRMPADGWTERDTQLCYDDALEAFDTMVATLETP